jgi:antagonist of KipI
MNQTGRVEVVTPGVLSTVQDSGRSGWRHLGVGLAGAMDPVAAAMANRLVGNPPDDAVLELTLRGPDLSFAKPMRIALCGAAIDAEFETLSGDRCMIPGHRPVTLPAGVLRLGAVRNGLRSWLAFGGGVDVMPVLGSRSTDLRGGFGGVEGRALRAGDRLPIGHSRQDIPAVDRPQWPGWWLAPEIHRPGPDAPIRLVPAQSADPAHRAAIESLLRTTWRVEAQSNRQGLRCCGEAPAVLLPEQLSAAVAPGTVQWPPDGRPIVLLADAQTVGGYPRLGHVIEADLARLAQFGASETLRFEAIDAVAAEALQRQVHAETARACLALEQRLSTSGIPPRAAIADGIAQV